MPQDQGLYHAEDEKDACGLAVVATHVPLGLEAPEIDLAAFRAAPEAAGADPFL